MTWTQAICNGCWGARNPGRVPYRIKVEYADEETCSYCGQSTRSGIYIRDDPKVVPYPRKEEA